MYCLEVSTMAKRVFPCLDQRIYSYYSDFVKWLRLVQPVCPCMRCSRANWHCISLANWDPATIPLDLIAVRARLGLEPGTPRTQSETHSPRPTSPDSSLSATPYGRNNGKSASFTLETRVVTREWKTKRIHRTVWPTLMRFNLVTILSAGPNSYNQVSI